MTDAEHRAALAKRFLAEMKSRGVADLDDPALAYHLALLLRPGGHPTIHVHRASQEGSGERGG